VLDMRAVICELVGLIKSSSSSARANLVDAAEPCHPETRQYSGDAMRRIRVASGGAAVAATLWMTFQVATIPSSSRTVGTCDADRHRIANDVGFSALRVDYANKSVADGDRRRIRIAAIEGPFRRLNALWDSEPESDSVSRRSFWVDYEFRSRALEALASRVLWRMFAEILDAFQYRADELFQSNKVRR
jgi:ribosome-associated toxin RatA of RatAB toxin-antitoxin module